MTAQEFKQLRRAYGLSVNDLAHILGLKSGDTIRRIEKEGPKLPMARHFEARIELFEINGEWT